MAKTKRGYQSMFGSAITQADEIVQTKTVQTVDPEPAVPASGKKRGRPVGSKGKKLPKEAVSLKVDGTLLYHLRWVSERTGIPFSRMMEDAARHLLLSSDWAFLLGDQSIDIIAERDKKLEDERMAIEGRYRRNDD